MSGKLRFNSWQGQQIYLISKMCRLTIEEFPDSYSLDKEVGLVPQGIAARAWRYRSPPPSTEVTNKWSCTSTPAYANTACTRLLSSGIKMNKWSTAPAVCTSAFCVVLQHLYRHVIHQLRLLTEQSQISRPTCVGPTLSSVLYITWKFYQH